MKYTLLTYNDAISLSGSFTSMIDLYLNLIKFVDVDLKIIFDIEAIGMSRYFRAQNFFGHSSLLSKCTKDKDHRSDGIIISCELLAQMAKGIVNLNIECDNLLMLDSFDLQRSKFGITSKLDQYIFCDNCTLLTNPSNFNILSVPTLEYYHKFNMERVLSIKNKNKIVNYRRSNKAHIKLTDDLYFENIGKVVFENIFLGNKVNYYPDKSQIKDGLYYYLKLFGVDGFKEHEPLKIKQEDVQEKLFMNENDIVLDIVRKGV